MCDVDNIRLSTPGQKLSHGQIIEYFPSTYEKREVYKQLQQINKAILTRNNVNDWDLTL